MSTTSPAAAMVRSTDLNILDNPQVLTHLAKVVWSDPAGNLAYTEDSDKVAVAATAWARQMDPKIFEIVPGKIYHAAGFQLCSTMIVVGDGGLVVVDPGENDEAAAATKAAFAQFSDLPVKAIVYTHRHPDHAFGSAGWGVTPEHVAAGRSRSSPRRTSSPTWSRTPALSATSSPSEPPIPVPTSAEVLTASSLPASARA
ncbi:MAG: MBL fold metallo-hydrolase [Nostocoides sp.]